MASYECSLLLLVSFNAYPPLSEGEPQVALHSCRAIHHDIAVDDTTVWYWVPTLAVI